MTDSHAICYIGEKTDNTAQEAAFSFLQTRSEYHPDIIRVRELMPERKYKIAQLRKITAGASVRPNNGELKVYIFEEADLMSEACQNALLKFTEEPPPFVRIIFTASAKDNFLETIRSRFKFINVRGDVQTAHNETAREFLEAFRSGSERQAASALAKIKTRDELHEVLTLISAGIHRLEPYPVQAQKFVLECINDLQFNPNIGLACANLTIGLFKAVK